MSKILVVIDSSVLPQAPAPLTSVFKRLGSLASQGVVEVFMPKVVLEEYRTQHYHAFKRAVRNARAKLTEVASALSELNDVGMSAAATPLEEGRSFARYVNELDVPREAEEYSDRVAKKLVDTLHAQVLPILPAHGQDVMDAYFRGLSPFPHRKAREHIPDAFIFQCIRDQSKKAKAGNLHAVIDDKNLREEVEQQLDCLVHVDVRGFLSCEDVMAAIAKLEDEEKHWADRFPFLRGALEELETQIVDRLSHRLVDALAGRTVVHHEIPEDNHEGLIVMVDEAQNVEIDFDSAQPGGPGNLTLPFECNTEVLLSFDVFRADAFDVPDGVSVSFGDPEIDHYFDAEAHVEVVAEGFIDIAVVGWKDDDETLDLVDLTIEEVHRLDVEEGEAGVFGCV